VGLPVQVVIANHAPVDLLQRVLRDGVLIVDADKAARVRFEVVTRNRWWDLKPVLDRIRGTKPRSGASAVGHG